MLAQDNEKSAVEATVRDLEQAFQDRNPAKLNSLLTPDARVIEESLPNHIDVEWKMFDKPRVAGIRRTFRLHDFETHVQGDVAWVTLTLDGTGIADSAEAQELVMKKPHAREDCVSQAAHLSCAFTFVESYVLVKTPSGWKIALIHSSRVPKDQK